MKQMTQIVHNKVKNPNWSEGNQLAVNKRGGGFELGTTVNKSSQRSGWDFNSGRPNFKFAARGFELGTTEKKSS